MKESGEFFSVSPAFFPIFNGVVQIRIQITDSVAEYGSSFDLDPDPQHCPLVLESSSGGLQKILSYTLLYYNNNILRLLI